VLRYRFADPRPSFAGSDDDFLYPLCRVCGIFVPPEAGSSDPRTSVYYVQNFADSTLDLCDLISGICSSDSELDQSLITAWCCRSSYLLNHYKTGREERPAPPSVNRLDPL